MYICERIQFINRPDNLEEHKQMRLSVPNQTGSNGNANKSHFYAGVTNLESPTSIPNGNWKRDLYHREFVSQHLEREMESELVGGRELGGSILFEKIFKLLL